MSPPFIHLLYIQPDASTRVLHSPLLVAVVKSAVLLTVVTASPYTYCVRHLDGFMKNDYMLLAGCQYWPPCRGAFSGLSNSVVRACSSRYFVLWGPRLGFVQ